MYLLFLREIETLVSGQGWMSMQFTQKAEKFIDHKIIFKRKVCDISQRLHNSNYFKVPFSLCELDHTIDQVIILLENLQTLCDFILYNMLVFKISLAVLLRGGIGEFIR